MLDFDFIKIIKIYNVKENKLKIFTNHSFWPHREREKYNEREVYFELFCELPVYLDCKLPYL